MMIPYGFDESNKDRRKRLYQNALRTADKLNVRIKHFISNTEMDYSLTKEQKTAIRKKLLENL